MPNNEILPNNDGVSNAGENPWVKMAEEVAPFNSGEQSKTFEMSDGDVVSQIFRNLNEARKEAIEENDGERAARLDCDMDVLNDAYNRMYEPGNQDKTMIDIFNDMRVEYFQKLDSVKDGQEKNEMLTRMLSASDFGSTYNGLKEYASKQIAQEKAREAEQNKVVDINAKLEELKAEITKREIGLKVLESYDQRDYGDSVVAASLRLAERKRDLDLLDNMLKRNNYVAEMTSEDAARILKDMVAERDEMITAIDKKLEDVEKRSEEWKQLKADRREAYRHAPEESVERVSKDIFGLE